MEITATRTAAGLLLSLILFATISVAQEDEGHGEEHGSGHAFERHTVGFFAGFAKEGSRNDEVALGIEYEYRINSSFGIGALAEYTYGTLDAWVYAVPFAYHRGPWKFYAAPGIEDTDEGSEPLLRLGTEYGFHRGELEISPQLDVDFVNGNQIFVVGLTFSRGF